MVELQIEIVTKSGIVYWLVATFFKRVALALEQMRNWHYINHEDSIGISSEKYPYDELQQAILEAFYGTVISGDDIVRITKNDSNLIQVYMKNSSIRLYRKDCYFFFIVATPSEQILSLTAHCVRG